MVTEMKNAIAAICAGLVTVSCCASLSELVDPKYAIKGNATSHFDLNPPVTAEVTTSSEIWRDASRQRDVPVKIYRPATVSGPLPVVIFSHGIGEDRDSYAYLGREWAGRGFLAVHITHAGTDKAVLESGYWHLYQATKKKENWVNRPLDVSFVLDQLAKRDDADLDRVAVAGHSAGAFTALAIAGLRFVDGSTLADSRVKVAIAISMPKMNGVIADDGYASIRIPVLHMTGTCDTSLIYRTFPKDRRVPFEKSAGPDQYLVTLEGVSHDTFSNREDVSHSLIGRITSAFLDGYLRGDPNARAFFEQGELSAMREVAVERKSVR